MSDENRAATLTAAALQVFGDASVQLSAAGGAFGMATSIVGGVLQLGAGLVRMFGTQARIEIPKMARAAARAKSVDHDVNTWLRDTLGVDLTATLSPDGAAKSGGVLPQDVKALCAAAEDLISMATGFGHEPHRDRVRAAATRLRDAIAKVSS